MMDTAFDSTNKTEFSDEPGELLSIPPLRKKTIAGELYTRDAGIESMLSQLYSVPRASLVERAQIIVTGNVPRGASRRAGMSFLCRLVTSERPSAFLRPDGEEQWP
jgi:hypothetical protein